MSCPRSTYWCLLPPRPHTTSPCPLTHPPTPKPTAASLRSHCQWDAVPRKRHVALPVAAHIGQRPRGAQVGGMEGRLPQHPHALLGHHVLAPQHLQERTMEAQLLLSSLASISCSVPALRSLLSGPTLRHPAHDAAATFEALTLSNVVLPAPLGPTSRHRAPWGRSIVMS